MMNDLQTMGGVAVLIQAAAYVVGGAAGILTVVPALDVLGAVFGLGFIVWFVWVGIVMLRSRPGAAYVKRPDQSNKRGRK